MIKTSENSKNKDIDKQVIEEAKTSADAFGKVYDFYFERVYSFVYFKVGSHAKAEDLTSEVFEKILKNISKYEDKGFKFITWVLRIANNAIIDHYKSASRKATTSLDNDTNWLDSFSSEEDLEEKTKTSLDKAELAEAIKQLKPEQQRIVFLRYIKEYTIEETAEITGRTKDSIKSLAKRAIKKLKDILNT